MYDMANLKKLALQGKLAPRASSAFRAFDEAALADGAIPKKYKELMAGGGRADDAVPVLHRVPQKCGGEGRRLRSRIG
jgi:hypothetical protein